MDRGRTEDEVQNKAKSSVRAKGKSKTERIIN
jgi:hypothetical protein